MIDGADFCFSGAASCIGLAFGRPVERTAEPDDKASDGARFEEIEENRGVIWFGDGLVLRTPVGVCQGSEIGWFDGELDKGFKVVVCFAGEFDAEVGSVDKVTDSILCSINVTWGAFVVMMLVMVDRSG